MKIKYLPLVLLLAGATVFGQKKEVRQAETAIEKQDFAGAESYLKEAQPLLNDMNDKLKARYYTAMGIVYGKKVNLDDVTLAQESFEKAMKFGNVEEGKKGLYNLQADLVKSALNDQNSENMTDAYKKFYKAYEMDKTDTIYLFVAAANAFNAQNDDMAIQYYKELVNIGYRGDEIQYTATHKEKQVEEVFGSKQDRDFFVQSGDYVNPQEKRTDRKDGEVARILAMAYSRKGDTSNALKAIKDARKLNPTDLDLIRMEAMIYEENGNKEEYVKILDELIKSDPKNADSYYVILGDNALKSNDIEAARGFYSNAIKANPNSVAGNNGMANTYLDQQHAIVDEMNSLGMSKADTQKYNKLSAERDELLKQALPYIEKAVENEENPGLLQTVYQIHSQLGNVEQAKKYKQKLDAITQ